MKKTRSPSKWNSPVWKLCYFIANVWYLVSSEELEYQLWSLFVWNGRKQSMNLLLLLRTNFSGLKRNVIFYGLKDEWIEKEIMMKSAQEKQYIMNRNWIRLELLSSILPVSLDEAHIYQLYPGLERKELSYRWFCPHLIESLEIFPFCLYIWGKESLVDRHKGSYNLKATQVYDALLSVSRLINSLRRRNATDYDRNWQNGSAPSSFILFLVKWDFLEITDVPKTLLFLLILIVILS